MFRNRPGYKHIRLSRQELYERVWETSVWVLAKEFGLSGVALRKRCRRHHIPTPGVGYWRRKETGKNVTRPRLPKITDPSLEQIEFSVPIHEGGEPATEAPEVAESIAIEKSGEKKINVSTDSENWLPIVQATVKSIRAAGLNERQLATPRRQGALGWEIAPASADRAGAIFDALLRACADRGYETSTNEYSGATNVVEVLEEKITVVLEEKVTRQDHVLTEKEQREREPWRRMLRPKYDYSPTGQLALKIRNGDYSGLRRTWADGRIQKLENLLNDFMLGLVRMAIYTRERRLENKQRANERRFEERRKEVKKLRRWLEAKRKERVLELAAEWRKAEELRSLIGAVRAKLDNSADGVDATSEWVAWASKFADEIDPLSGGLPKLLQAHNFSRDWKTPFARRY